MMHGAAARAAIISQLALLAAGCAPVQNSVPDTTASSTTGATAVSAAQRAAGWRPLFDGTSTSAWRGYKSQTFPAGWKIVDGVLTKSGSAEDIQTQVFEVGKRHPFDNLRAWFQALYETLLGSSQGPRMGSFIALYGIDNSRRLIAEALAEA